MICGLTYYQICWYFLIYSFGGWVVEVIFHAVALGKVVNRGFLNGPVCPVYGFGVDRAMCTRFQSLYDLVVNIFPQYKNKFLVWNVDPQHGNDELQEKSPAVNV